MKIENYRKRYIYYSDLICLLNMCENTKKSIFMKRRKYKLDDNLLACAEWIFYTNVCSLNDFNILQQYNFYQM